MRKLILSEDLDFFATIFTTNATLLIFDLLGLTDIASVNF